MIRYNKTATCDSTNSESWCHNHDLVADGHDELSSKWQSLKAIIATRGNAVVAFSGGVDSTFILKAAALALGNTRVIAATAGGPSVPTAELSESTELAKLINVEHIIVDAGEIDDPQYKANPNNRCYFCKTNLYRRLRQLAIDRGFSCILNGTNKDDLGDYRPGLLAAREYEVCSPAVDADLSKTEIRELSRRLGLPTFDKPAGPCLASRIQYGESITVEKLKMVESAETILHELGIRECRVRHHGKIARIEVAPDYFALLADTITSKLIDTRIRALGYDYVTLDLRGFRSGSMNEVINIAHLPTNRQG